ncbi:hypothetical protein CSB08_01165 [Candidatus Gracilibacteria bacterium]|nr:MAG: hypothetical protein CSB08_01165 [Candidatus Gracilibacteria bacterium]PIE85580.1 MAG: hypothetical protein CSA08_01240 [Candidatus Gracilibacteria bacterium]
MGNIEKNLFSGFEIPIQKKEDKTVLYLLNDLVYKSYKDNEKNFDGEIFYSGYVKSFRKFLKGNILDEHNIQKVGFKSGNILLYFKGEERPRKLAFSDFQKELVFGNKKIDIEKVENKVHTLHFAMETIYFQNNGWFFEGDKSELDGTDIIENIPNIIKNRKKIPQSEHLKSLSDEELTKLLEQYKGMNLGDLREELKIEQDKLRTYYNIRGETKKSLSLLEKEIMYDGAVGDEYDDGARVLLSGGENKKENFSPNVELSKKIDDLIKAKTTKELIDFIRVINNKIDKNGKIPDMAKTQNLALIKYLTEKTFEKMKIENSSNRDFINFIRIITGRELTDENGNIKKFQTYVPGEFRMSYQSIKLVEKPENKVKVNEEFKQIELARKVCLYLLYKNKGVEQIEKSQDIKIEDSIYTEKKKEKRYTNGSLIPYEVEVSGEKITSIETILDRTFEVFEEIGLDRNELSAKMGLNSLLGKKDIISLDFNEKLLLGTIYRISKNLKKNFEKMKGKTSRDIQEFLGEANNQALEETFKELNNSFESNFDATFWDLNWDGKDSSEFSKLSQENKEIFDLYGKINGRGYFELADDSFVSQTILTKEMGVVLAVGLLTAYLVLPGVIMSAGGWALLSAGAKIGATTSIASQIMDNKGYATNAEALAGVSSQLAIDILFSAIFTLGSGAIIGKVLGKKFLSTLTKEVQKGELSKSTISRLRDISKEMEKETTRNFGALGKFARTPEKFWKPQAQNVLSSLRTLEKNGFAGVEAFKKAGFTGELSDNTIKYLAKYSATTSGVGQVGDMGIGLVDGAGAGILGQVIEYKFLYNTFAHSHFDPEAGETMYNVFDKRKEEKKLKKQQEKAQKLREKQEKDELERKVQSLDLESEEVRKLLEKRHKTNPKLKEIYNNMSESEKREVIFAIIYNESISKAKNNALAKLTKVEKDSLYMYFRKISRDIRVY